MNTHKKPFIITGVLLAIIVGFFVFGFFFSGAQSSTQPIVVDQIPPENTIQNDQLLPVVEEIKEGESLVSFHQKTPETVRALYMSAWTASSIKDREKLLKTIESSNSINAIVLDIKDATGRVSFLVDDPIVANTGSPENKISDIREFIQQLHEKNIYVIGRISVFQDPYLTKKYPEWAIQSISKKSPWKDKKGLSFLDPTQDVVHTYIIALARASYEIGFDEINFDYIRFPSDGNMQDIQYPENSGTRSEILERFFKKLHSEMTIDQIPTSADLFGLTTEATDDMGIGQVLEKVLPYFDFIAPMIYPSHYGKGYQGFSNPAEHPYAVVKSAMQQGIARAANMELSPSKFRPWIQDFDMGASYGTTEILDQIKALEELDIQSFMIWDPANRYTQNVY